MITHREYDLKLTPKQAAQAMILYALEIAANPLDDLDSEGVVAVKGCTERERQEIARHIQVEIGRIAKRFEKTTEIIAEAYFDVGNPLDTEPPAPVDPAWDRVDDATIFVSDPRPHGEHTAVTLSVGVEALPSPFPIRLTYLDQIGAALGGDLIVEKGLAHKGVDPPDLTERRKGPKCHTCWLSPCHCPDQKGAA